MCEDGGRGAERAVEKNLFWRIGHVIRSADHVADVHVDIVYDNAKMVCGTSVGAQQDEVLNRLALDGDFAEDGIIERHRSLRNFEPDRAAIAAGEPLAYFIGR